MDDLVCFLHKRRIKTMGIVVLLAIAAIAVSLNLHVSASTYFDGRYNKIFIYALIIYKLLELPILYYLLFHRHLKVLNQKSEDEEFLLKLRKHSKLLLFLVPQGNTVFGVIAFKLSGSVLYFLIFSFIAIITLYLIKPNKFKLY